MTVVCSCLSMVQRHPRAIQSTSHLPSPPYVHRYFTFEYVSPPILSLLLSLKQTVLTVRHLVHIKCTTLKGNSVPNTPSSTEILRSKPSDYRIFSNRSRLQIQAAFKYKPPSNTSRLQIQAAGKMKNS